MAASDRLPSVQFIVDIDDCDNLKGLSQEEARAKH